MSISHNTQDGNGLPNTNSIRDTSTSSVSPNNITLTYSQEVVGMIDSFYYRPNNDFQIYHINCKEIIFNELISQVNDYLNSSHNYHYSNNLFVFYFQNPNDHRIYRVDCEMIPHSNIVQYLNSNIYDVELNQSEQQQTLEFSNGQKQNLEFHLKQFFITNMSIGNNFIDSRSRSNASLVNSFQPNTTDNDQYSTSQQHSNN